MYKVRVTSKCNVDNVIEPNNITLILLLVIHLCSTLTGSNWLLITGPVLIKG